MNILRAFGVSWLTLTSLSTWAIPVDMLSLTFTQVLSADIGTTTAVDQDFGITSINSSASTIGGSGQAVADLAAGTLKTEAVSSIPSASISKSLVNAFAHAYDVLHFAEATTVTYELHIEGELAVGSDGTSARNASNIYVFNISDVMNMYADDPSGFISITDLLTDETWSNVINSASVFKNDANTTPGTIVNIDGTISASLDVDPSDFYLFFLYQTSYTNTSGLETTSADFFATSTFDFTDLGGTSFESASGVFPGSSGRIPVPAPPPVWMILPCLGIVVFRIRLKGRRLCQSGF